MSDTIDLIVSVTATVTSAAPTVPGVSTPAIIAYHTHNTDAIRTYFDLAGMVADGFSVHEPGYLAALALVTQSPHPDLFKVIRGTSAVGQVVSFKVTDTTDTHVVGLTLTDAAGAAHAINHTNTTGQTAAQIATALAAVSVSGATLAVDGVDTAKVNITIAAAGAVWYPSLIAGGTYLDVTPTTSPGTDLTAAANADPDFYGIAGAWMSATIITAIAVWAEANKRQHWYVTADTNNVSTNNAGVFQDLENAGYTYSVGIYSRTPIAYANVAWMSTFYTTVPGASVAAYRSLVGVPVDALTATEITNAGQLLDVPTKNGNVYIVIAATNNTVDGRAASGMFADIRRGIDALSRDIQTSVFGLLRAAIAAGSKIGYDRAGIATVGAEVMAAMQRFVQVGFLDNDIGFQPQVSLPDPANIPSADRQARILRNVNASCIADNGIQRVKVNLSLGF